jgi:hypothetical protein
MVSASARDDATQKLVDEAAREWLMGYHGSVDTTALLLAFKAGSRWRPPVSPEEWEAGIEAATEAVDAVLTSVERGSGHGERDIAEAALNAARFSLPVLDVEKVAAWLVEEPGGSGR